MAKAPSRFLALLRGVNVGGKNVIAKNALKRCFEDLGFSSVRTYIQSGNILFRSDRTRVEALTEAIQHGLSDRFSYAARAVVLSHGNYRSAVRAAPDAWGHDDAQRHNALFTLTGITPKRVLARLPSPKTDVETVTAGPGVIFWSVSREHVTRSTWIKLPASPVYQQVTARNHNTVFKLLELFEEILPGSGNS